MKTLSEEHSNPVVSSARTPADGKSKMNLLETVRDRIKYRLVLQSISDMLEWLGIAVVPYYTFEESFVDKLSHGLNLQADSKPLTAGFLAYPEVEKICISPEGEGLESEMEKLRGDGCRCFALKQGDEVVSYMLCNFNQCDSRLVSFPLQDGEVYLFGAYTFAAHRGRNLAAVLEYELYKQLYAMGLEKYHSVNILYNTPGLRFKEKLQSRPVKLCLYISFFKIFRWNIILRKYRKCS